MMRLLTLSAPALLRLAFRIMVIAMFGRFWPGRDAPSATAALCLLLAAGCGIAAYAKEEPVVIAPFNRWGEAVILIALAGLVMLVRMR